MRVVLFLAIALMMITPRVSVAGNLSSLDTGGSISSMDSKQRASASPGLLPVQKRSFSGADADKVKLSGMDSAPEKVLSSKDLTSHELDFKGESDENKSSLGEQMDAAPKKVTKGTKLHALDFKDSSLGAKMDAAPKKITKGTKAHSLDGGSSFGTALDTLSGSKK